MSANLIVQDSNLYRNDFIATSVAAFCINSEHEENYRKLPILSLNLLLVQRNTENNLEFSLPNSLIKKNESSLQSIQRELFQKASISECYIEQLYTFTEFTNTHSLTTQEEIACANVSTISHIALINDDKNHNTDSFLAENISSSWFKISYENINNYYDKDTFISEFLLKLRNESISLSATILQKKNENELENTVQVVDANGISPISAQIISYAITRLRGKIEYTDIAFRLLPETFSIKTLQKVYELVLGKKLLDANFRRKILPKLSETIDSTHENIQSLGHRKAKLYTLKKKIIHNFNNTFLEIE